MSQFHRNDIYRLNLKLRGWLVSFCLAGAMLTNVGAAQEIPDDFGPPVAKTKPVYFPPEHFPNTNEWETFRIHAIEFLQDHADDVMAPRAIHDMILIETIRAKPNQAEINALKTRLAFEYPDSLALAVTLKSFKDQSEYRNLLMTEFRKPEQTFSPDFCRQFLKASELGLTAFGPVFTNDDGFAQLIDLALNDGKSFRLRQLTDEKFQNMKGMARSGMELGRKAELSRAEKVIGLHSIGDAATAKRQSVPQGLGDAIRYWISRLSSEERQLPQIREILIEHLLSTKKFQQALPELDALLAIEQQPKWMFWRAWSLASEQQFDAASLALEQLAKQFPSDAWSKLGADFAIVLRERNAAMRENADAILELVTQLQSDDFEALKLHVAYHPIQGKLIELWATGDAVNHSLDVFINYGSVPFVGYKTTLNDYSIFLRDQGKIVQINKPGIFLDFTLGLNQTAQGLSSNFNFNTASTPAAANSWRRAIRDLAKNPLVANRDAVVSLLHLNLKSVFPLRMKTVDGRRIYRWFQFDLNRPQSKPFEFELTSTNQRQIRFRDSFGTTAEVTFGKVGSVVAESRWKDLPITKKDEFDFTLIMQAVMMASTMLKTDEDANETPQTAPMATDGGVVPAAAIEKQTTRKIVQPLGIVPK
ncbi:MAG: uncharacterized protein JWM11_1959 [Planctomycetaceae bacterium]|nr:uncharacterized protein [Planctomycetaceae bacterium]